MKGITFGQYHSYRDFNLILSSKEMGAQTVKSKKLDIDGEDGSLDMTDYFGEPKYEDVTHRFDFSTIVPQSEFLSLFSCVKNAIHGKKQRIILDDDPSFAWVGRCYVTKFTNEKGIGTISVECDCEPWKYKNDYTVIAQTISGTQSIILTNGRKRAVPEVQIHTEGSVTIENGGHMWSRGTGVYTLPELELTEGENVVTVTGTGTITFSWQEGSL